MTSNERVVTVSAASDRRRFGVRHDLRCDGSTTLSGLGRRELLVVANRGSERSE